MVEAQASIPDHMIMLTTSPLMFSQEQYFGLERRTSKVDLVVAFNVHLYVFDCL